MTANNPFQVLFKLQHPETDAMNNMLFHFLDVFQKEFNQSEIEA